MDRNSFPRPGTTVEVSGWGCWLVLLAFGIFLGFIGLGWLVSSFLVLLAALIVVPILFIAGLLWWVRRNVVRAPCPVCQTEFSALQGNPCRCPNCGEPLQVRAGAFERITPEGTIDVEAVATGIEIVDVAPTLPAMEMREIGSEDSDASPPPT